MICNTSVKGQIQSPMPANMPIRPPFRTTIGAHTLCNWPCQLHGRRGSHSGQRAGQRPLPPCACVPYYGSLRHQVAYRQVQPYPKHVPRSQKHQARAVDTLLLLYNERYRHRPTLQSVGTRLCTASHSTLADALRISPPSILHCGSATLALRYFLCTSHSSVSYSLCTRLKVKPQG